jgi:large subunit ribosomal protein L1
MAKLTKRIKALREAITPGQMYDITAALKILKTTSKVKFKESIDVSINLGVDPRKSDQMVRGSTVLPHGTGKSVRVAVFAQGDKQTEAKNAGADIVGFDDLAESIKAGNMDFDVLIATPDAMRVVGQLGQILGPRGLMPNPKVGTVSADVATAVKNAKAGQVRYRTDKAGIIHSTIGKVDFSEDALRENLLALMSDLKKLKPSTSKGIYFKKVTVSSTMGPGLQVEQSSVAVA